MRALLFALLAVATASTALSVEHFKAWGVVMDDHSFTKKVTIKGQFDEKPVCGTIRSIQLLFNPANKHQEGVHDEKSHLVAYLFLPCDFKKEVPNIVVTFHNQFSEKDQQWTIAGHPSILLLPAGKSLDGKVPEVPPAKALDHFACYNVIDSKPLAKEFTLTDQFDRKWDHVEQIKEVEPWDFCVPISKNGSRISDPKTHLAVYDIDPTEKAHEELTVTTHDQFRVSKLTVRESLKIAVPTIKRHWERMPEQPTVVKKH